MHVDIQGKTVEAAKKLGGQHTLYSAKEKQAICIFNT